MLSKLSWTGSIINRLKAHSHIWINPKITNYVESNLFMWQDIVDLNMIERSSWNSLETIRTGVEGVIANCSWPDYDCIEHQGLSMCKYSLTLFVLAWNLFPRFSITGMNAKHRQVVNTLKSTRMIKHQGSQDMWQNSHKESPPPSTIKNKKQKFQDKIEGFLEQVVNNSSNLILHCYLYLEIAFSPSTKIQFQSSIAIRNFIECLLSKMLI